MSVVKYPKLSNRNQGRQVLSHKVHISKVNIICFEEAFFQKSSFKSGFVPLVLT